MIRQKSCGSAGKMDLLPAIGANAGEDGNRSCPLTGIDFLAAIDGKLDLAIGAGHFLLIAQKSLSHRAGGNDKSLGGERLEKQNEDDNENNGFNDLANAVPMLCRLLPVPSLGPRLLFGMQLGRMKQHTEQAKKPEHDRRVPLVSAWLHAEPDQPAEPKSSFQEKE